MQFEDLSKNAKVGVEDFRKFYKNSRGSYALKTILERDLLYFLLWKSDPGIFFRYNYLSVENVLKILGRPEFNFIFDLARKKNFWLKDK